MSEHDARAIDQLGRTFLLHANTPLNLGSLEKPDGSARLVGQCGDAIKIDLKVRGDVIDEICVLPEGCVFTRVCASVVSELADKKSLDQALEIEPEQIRDILGDLPEDHLHCARLAVNTLGEAIAEVLRKKAETS
ncbi:MAG TPA: iron-sulfur cluster assembly scaffold protein [Desulfobulbus sp.]|nr:iron-sulfur cluster assembly scaffold protein [Desulfobulbus sp.]HHD64844.1 iron-sulfur cluster assembly scaffold protein [Desulfobulbaceae bacterium]